VCPRAPVLSRDRSRVRQSNNMQLALHRATRPDAELSPGYGIEQPSLIAAELIVPERLLLFCLASNTDRQAANMTHATA
jgi:hypothetical protein